MLKQLSRPNFFPGQMIDYRDFNRLSEQSERVMTFLCSHLFEGGGIVVRALDEFRVEPTAQLGVVIKPGVAFLPNGQPLVLTKDLTVDLTEYRSRVSEKTLYISLQSQPRGTDRFQDPADPSIEGFQSQTYEPEMVVSTKAPVEGGIELFRVTLSKAIRKVRLPSLEEEWDGYTAGETDDTAVIDLRHRSYIVPQTYRPVDSFGLLQLRRDLYQIERSHRKIQKIFLCEDASHAENYLIQLHAELLSLPFQPVKVAFLICEFAEKLSLFMEFLSQRVGNTHENFNREVFLKTMTLLDAAKIKRATPRDIPLSQIKEIAALLDQFSGFAEERFNLLNSVEEAIADFRDRTLDYSDQLTLAGHVFERVDKIGTEQANRWRANTPDVHVRNVQTTYKNGDSLALKGAFLKNGAVSIDIRVPSPDRPVVVLLRQYVRRADAVLRYDINGKELLQDRWDKLGLSNNWMNRGFVIPPEALVPTGNKLEICVEKTDLDYGFFELSVYQPTTFKGEYA